MRYKIPRWVGLATLLITATKLGIPAFAQDFEPIEPGVDVVDPGVDVVDPPCLNGPPGLYNPDCSLAPGVTAYEPAYKLWSDGAAKDRYYYLPPIDPKVPSGPKQPINANNTNNPNRWIFPIGTRFYKTFKQDNEAPLKYETRIIEKGPTRWSMTTYEWDRDQKNATLVTGGRENVFGDDHDIPTQGQCGSCHNSPERPLGFSAIQLSPTGMLRELVNRGELTDWATEEDKVEIAAAEQISPEQAELAKQQALENYIARATIQGDVTQREAVGYLHANCGHCHGGGFSAAGMSLFSQVLTKVPAEPQTAPNGLTAICTTTEWTRIPSDEEIAAGVEPERYGYQIHPGNAADSAILARMHIRDPGRPTDPKFNQMPPVATEKPDIGDGIVKVTNWINGLADTCTPVAPEVEAPEALF
jgi:hypothetical protein